MDWGGGQVSAEDPYACDGTDVADISEKWSARKHLLPEDKYILVEGIRIRYWDEGEGPVVLLIHGFNASCDYWQWNFADLAAHFRVLALDLPGHGLSEKKIPDYSALYAAHFLNSFLTALGVSRAYIVGESLGGALAMALAVYHPERVAKLVLSNSAGLGGEISLGFRLLGIPGLRTLLAIFLTAPNRRVIKFVQRSATYQKQVITDEWVNQVCALARQPGLRQTVLGLARFGLDWRGQRRAAWEPVFKRLGEISAPTLILWGAQDTLIPVTHAYTAQRCIAGAKLRIFEECGHMTHMEVPQEFNRVVLDFLLSSGKREKGGGEVNESSPYACDGSDVTDVFDPEDQEDREDAQRALEEYRAGGGRPFSEMIEEMCQEGVLKQEGEGLDWEF